MVCSVLTTCGSSRSSSTLGLGVEKTRAVAFQARTTCRYYSGFGGEGARGPLFCAPVPPEGASTLIRLKSAMLPNQRRKRNDSLDVVEEWARSGGTSEVPTRMLTWRNLLKINELYLRSQDVLLYYAEHFPKTFRGTSAERLTKLNHVFHIPKLVVKHRL